MGAEGGDEGEFVFVGGVDDDGADAGAYQIGDDGGVVRDERLEVEVEMGVVEGRHRRRWRRLPTEYAEDTERKPRDAVRGVGVRGKRAGRWNPRRRVAHVTYWVTQSGGRR